RTLEPQITRITQIGRIYGHGSLTLAPWNRRLRGLRRLGEFTDMARWRSHLRTADYADYADWANLRAWLADARRNWKRRRGLLPP
ncbi:MAG: hypothetical protein MJZ70_00415, partial [Bacteroidales bacterium]|nr:hypothetical protein [Bacteroidales bacterium]